MNLYPASLEKTYSILGIGSASKTVISFKTRKSIQKRFELSVFLMTTTGEHYGLSKCSTKPKSIIDLTSSTTVSSILNGNGYCLTRTGVSVVNLMSWSNKVVLPGLSENVSDKSFTRESTCSFSSVLKFWLIFTCELSCVFPCDRVLISLSMTSSFDSSDAMSITEIAQTCDISFNWSDCSSSSLFIYCFNILMLKVFTSMPTLILLSNGLRFSTTSSSFPSHEQCTGFRRE